MQAQQTADRAGSVSSPMVQVDNTVDVTPYLRNPFLKELQKKMPEHYGRFVVRAMDDAAVAREIERIDRRMARLRAVGRKFKEFCGPLTQRQRVRFARLTQEYVQAKAQRKAISAEQDYRRQRSESLAELSKQSSAEKARNVERLRKEQWQASGLADSTASFESLSLDPNYPERKPVIEYVEAWAENYPNVDKGLHLFGFTGVGKTTLVKALARKLNQKPVPVASIFIKCSYLGSTLEAEKREKPEISLMQRAKLADVVILDDLDKGLGGLASFDAQRFVRELLDWLDDEKRTPVFTSEWPLCPDPRYADGEGNLVCYKNDVKAYVFGRVAGLADCLELTGPNYRILDSDQADTWWAK